MRTKRSTVAFLEGHGEFDRYQVLDFSNALTPNFDVKRITTTTLGQFADNFEILVVAGPTEPFNEADKFIIDQYVMNGGKVMWLIDAVAASMKLEPVSTSKYAHVLTV